MADVKSTATVDPEKMCYYERLGLEKDVPQDIIRKAYLRASLKWHPDKNPDNPEAEEIFKEISEAYAVLSDEARRERYDKYGFEAAKEMDIDPEELFEQMFGTRDPVEALKKIMSDPELRGPVILGTGLAATVAGVATTIHAIKNKKGGSAVLTAVGGLAGTLGGLTLAVGGLVTWGADAGIQATKRGINNIDKKIDEMKAEHMSSKTKSIETESVPETEKAAPKQVFTETETRSENKTTPDNNENIYPNLANSNNNNNRGPFSEAKGLRQEQADAAYARKLQEAEFRQ